MIGNFIGKLLAAGMSFIFFKMAYEAYSTGMICAAKEACYNLQSPIKELAILGFTLSGIGIAWLLVKNLRPKPKGEELKCPGCGFTNRGDANSSCSKCGTTMELLDGFYYRHPGFKDKSGD